MSNMNFSVAMCVYGGDNAAYFKEALESVYNQTRIPNEVVLAVDGPVPHDIESVILKYEQEKGIKVVRLKENMGHGHARRASLEQCTNELVAIADADDINAPTRFEKELELFETNPELTAISTDCYHFVDSIDNPLYRESMPTGDDQIKKALRTKCPLTQASVMFKKSKVDEAGGYLDWYHAEDYYLWIRLYLNGAVFANIPECLLYVRSNPSYISRRGGYKYFKSLKKLFWYMYKNNIISYPLYLYNVMTRFVAQVLLPGNMRSLLRKVVS